MSPSVSRSHRLAASLLAALCVAMLSSAGHGAQQTKDAAAPAGLLDELVWVGPAPSDQTAASIVGFGPDYAAEFDNTLLYAPRDAENATLELSLIGLELGGRVFHEVDPERQPALDGERVRYELGAWGEERFTFRRDGIKHDVILERLPEDAPAGDLVVRLALSAPGARPGPLAAGTSLALEYPDGNGVRFGELLVLDADGRQAIGQVALEDDALSYTVPAGFLAEATLPLVIDPLIASHFMYASMSSGKTVSPDVAYAEHLDGYGIAWQHEPHRFPIAFDDAGEPSEYFTPDFYLPETDEYIELTVLRQCLCTHKNRKLRLMRELYPEIR